MPLLASLVLTMALGSAAVRPVQLPMPPMTALPAPPPPNIDAAAWMVYSVAGEAELGSHNADRPLAPASITKLMTAILVVEQALLTDPVEISTTAASTPIGFLGQPRVLAGETWSVAELLANIMVQSGNDAAVALAEHVAGTAETFVEMMNRRAGELGMADTVFVTPNGLDHADQLSSARDLVLLGREALNHPEVMRAARIKQVLFVIGNRRVEVGSTNRDLGVYPGYLGLKTGDTLAAGQVLLSYTETPHDRLIAVVLGSGNRRLATRELITWGATSLGPRDHFFAAAAGTDVAEAFPEWYRTRLSAAGFIPGGDPDLSGNTPLTDDVVARFRELLPQLLGGSR